jgi:hypothetical protein
MAGAGETPSDGAAVERNAGSKTSPGRKHPGYDAGVVLKSS